MEMSGAALGRDEAKYQLHQMSVPDKEHVSGAPQFNGEYLCVVRQRFMTGGRENNIHTIYMHRTARIYNGQYNAAYRSIAHELNMLRCPKSEHYIVVAG